MNIYRDLNSFSAKNPVLSIGTFDGVHLGHRNVLKKVVERAKAINGESVILSFWPHPRLFFEREKSNLKFLNTIEEKSILLESIGIDHFIILPFSEVFANLAAEQYIEEIIYKKIHPSTVIIGYDHRFGKNGSGNFETLSKLSSKFNFTAEKIEKFEIDEINVSSTKIRKALTEGNIEKANEYLSYDYFIKGLVVQGMHIGQTIGFPTANIQLLNKLKIVPSNGIYITEINLENQNYQGVVNIGYRPTFNSNKELVSIEIHILDFNRNIYESEITITFKKRLRDEIKFTNIAELRQQIASDVEKTRQFFREKINI